MINYLLTGLMLAAAGAFAGSLLREKFMTASNKLAERR
jgi:hypothetical protein